MSNPVTGVWPFDGTLSGTTQSGAASLTGTGAVRWLLPAGARVNYLFNPAFGAATWDSEWSVYQASKTLAAGAGPEGQDAASVSRTAAPSGGLLYQTGPPRYVIGSGDMVLSAYVSRGGGALVAADFSVTVLGGSATVNIESVGGGWYRVWGTRSATSSGFGNTGIQTNTYDNVLMTKFQLEPGTTPTAYITPGYGHLPNAGGLTDDHAGATATGLGLWLEPGSSNVCPNPWTNGDLSVWTATNGTKAVSLRYVYEGSVSAQITASAANAELSISVTAPAVVHTAQAIAGNGAAADRQCQLTYNGSLIGSPVTVPAQSRKAITAQFTGTGSAAALGVRWLDSANTELFAVAYLGGEPGTVATSPVPAINTSDTILSGYGWDGTAHASTSTRAASSAAISPSGILTPDSGSLAFRLTRKIDTGAEERYGECGQKASGKDHLRWGVDSSDHPFVEWSSNNAAYQRLTGTETISVNTEYLFYLGWNGVLTELSIDAGTKHTGTRDVVEDDFSVGDLTLEASAGGVIVSPFATFDRPLTDTEIATLAARQGWSMSTLDSTTRRIRAQFELRPAY